MCATICASGTCLANQCPTILQVEQTREGVATTIVRLLVQLAINAITLFVTGFGICPTCLRTNLRCDKCGGAIREVKAGSLAKNQRALHATWSFGNTILKSHIVISYHKGNSHLQLLFVLEC